MIVPPVVLSHQQEVWLYSLEWCESRGVPSAINPKDTDGQPRNGAFQFATDTLNYYAQIFKVSTTSDVLNYTVQKKILTEMILHKDKIKWETQFPSCVKLLGNPPA